MKINFATAILFIPILILTIACGKKSIFGETVITRWKDGKTGAVSLTFDDGSINQFRVAVPVLDSLGMPGTFFIITGEIPGSRYSPRFIGRPMDKIISETAVTPTDSGNLFERASVVAYAPYKGLREYFTRAGEFYESGKVKEACQVLDQAFARVRNHSLKPIRATQPDTTQSLTWNRVRHMAAHGHEFASHTVTHPYLCILDEANIQYELEKSKEEIDEQLGPRFTFSAECPYGIEDSRVMEFAYKTYPALRNRMPEPFLAELDRSSHLDPGAQHKEYVQWQRGALTATPMNLMNSWIDTCTSKDNIWLVLVFHGVEGIGWEPLKREVLVSYFSYLHSRENKLWVATFGDVSRYMRERMASGVITKKGKDRLEIRVTNPLGKDYDIPLTLKTYVAESRVAFNVRQGIHTINFHEGTDDKGSYIIYSINPNGEAVHLTASE